MFSLESLAYEKMIRERLQKNAKEKNNKMHMT